MNDIEKTLFGVEEVKRKLCVRDNRTDIVNGRKIFYISDIHMEFMKIKNKSKEWDYKQYVDHVIQSMKAGGPNGDEPLLIIGDISLYFEQVGYFLSQLRMCRDGEIIFILGNHEIWMLDKTNKETNKVLSEIIWEYRTICKKYKIIFLHNDLLFLYDERTKNGELLPFFKQKIILEDELISIESEIIKEYAKKAKLIVFGGLGFSGKCKTINKNGRLYNAELGLYRTVIPTLKEDIIETEKCENAYRKVLKTLENKHVIIATHCPFNHWSDCDYNSNYIYVSGHTHHNYFEKSKKRTIFADNQVGYYSDNYELRYFYVDGTYDTFEDFVDGIYPISYEQYIDFNIGKNIRMKKKDDNKQIYMIKNAGFYMFVCYAANKSLILLNGGNRKRLIYKMDYYYENLGKYGNSLKKIIEQYTNVLESLSNEIKSIGGDGKIHGCIIDIDYYNHIYVNPFDGKIVPYYAIDATNKYVYNDIKIMLKERCPLLLEKIKNWDEKSFDLIPLSFEISDRAILVQERNIYRVSNTMRIIQYLVYQNVVRDWNDKVLSYYDTKFSRIVEEIGDIVIDEKVFR